MSVTQDYKITLSKAQRFEIVHALREQEASYRRFLRDDPTDEYFLTLVEQTKSALAAVVAAV